MPFKFNLQRYNGVLNSTKRAAVVMMSILALGEKPSVAALATLAVVIVGGAGYGGAVQVVESS